MVEAMRAIILISLFAMLGCQQPQPNFSLSEKDRQSLRDTMEAAAKAASASQQSEIASGFSEVKAELKANTDTLLAIKTKIDQMPEPAVKEETPEPVKQKLYYTTIPDCGPCLQLKNDIAAGVFADFDMVELPDDTWSGGYPVIRWKENGQWMYATEPVRDRRGRTTWVQHRYNRQLVDLIKSRLLRTPVQAPSSSVFDPVKSRGSNYESRQAMINHLMNEGTHAGRHSLAKLNSMTDMQLSDLHTEDHDESGS